MKPMLVSDIPSKSGAVSLTCGSVREEDGVSLDRDFDGFCIAEEEVNPALLYADEALTILQPF